MCSIAGLQGKFSGNEIIKMLKASKYRGVDASGVYLDNIYLNIDLDKFNDDKFYSIGFGHNLLSVYDSNQRLSKPQPVSNDNLTLIFDGQLYNFPTIRNLVVKVGVCEEINSDADALLYLIEFYCKKMEMNFYTRNRINIHFQKMESKTPSKNWKGFCHHNKN